MSKKIITILFLLTVLFSCKKETLDECPKCPVVTSLHPNEAHFEDTVLILGRNLLPDFNHNDILEVKFNGKVIPYEYIIDNYDDSIRVIIPKGTESGPVTVDLNVKDELVSAGSANFTYLYKYTVSTLAGTGFQGTSDNPDPLLAEFGLIKDITYNPVNNDVYVLESNKIKIISPVDGVLTLLSTGLSGAETIACSYGGQVYVGYFGDCVIKKLIFQNGNWSLTNYAGTTGNCNSINGNINTATFKQIFDIIFDPAGNLLVSEGSTLRKISFDNTVSSIAGNGIYGFQDGTAITAQFSNIWALDFDHTGNIYLADWDNNRNRKLSAGFVSTIAGTGTAGFSNGPALTSEITHPEGIAADNSGNVFFTDQSRHCIRKIDLNNSEVSVMAGSSNGAIAGYIEGDPLIARFNEPTKLTFNKTQNILYVVDSKNYVIRQITRD